MNVINFIIKSDSMELYEWSEMFVCLILVHSVRMEFKSHKQFLIQFHIQKHLFVRKPIIQ